MKYYRIHFTLNPKFRGSNEYIKNYKLKIPGNKLFWEEPKFIGNVRNEKINFEPYLLDIELHASSKINDLIMDGGPVATKLIISGKMKTILEKYRRTGLQFFNINILKKDSIFKDYWLLNMFVFNQEYIDYKNCKIIYEEKAEDFEVSYQITKISIDVNNQNEFESYIEKAQTNTEVVWIEKLALKQNLSEDFFILKYVNGGVGYFVSETLRQEIEHAGCTGIEFQLSELSYAEWTARDAVRDQVYGRSW